MAGRGPCPVPASTVWPWRVLSMEHPAASPVGAAAAAGQQARGSGMHGGLQGEGRVTAQPSWGLPAHCFHLAQAGLLTLTKGAGTCPGGIRLQRPHLKRKQGSTGQFNPANPPRGSCARSFITPWECFHSDISQTLAGAFAFCKVLELHTFILAANLMPTSGNTFIQQTFLLRYH